MFTHTKTMSLFMRYLRAGCAILQILKSFDDLPNEAKIYLRRLEEVSGAPIKIVSTGPDREQTMFV